MIILPIVLVTSYFYNWINCLSWYPWVYRPTENKIYLCKDYQFEWEVNKKWVLVHETWHFVFFKVIDDSERSEYKKLYDGCDIYSRCFVSLTAYTRYEEDFAEIFLATYNNVKSDEYTINLKLEFMDRIFKKYKIKKSKYETIVLR